MRLSDLAVLGVIVVQTIAGLAAALWRCTRGGRATMSTNPGGQTRGQQS
jgi:hypothetical protein